ncbi:Fungal-trans domain-containing protein [Mycena kentingensis (nom. inval.)]|nr:Fungal-trans domain-containing protein [Mycena kentingensis (nom. inval.)]
MAPTPYERPSILDLDGSAAKGKGPSKASKRILGQIACAEDVSKAENKVRPPNPMCNLRETWVLSSLSKWCTIPPGEGSRFVLAATDHLHTKLARMQARMHALEDAIAILQGSDKPHPLLLNTEAEDSEEEMPPDESTLNLQPVPEEDSSLVDALGSLHVDGEGGSRFFGPAGGAEARIRCHRRANCDPESTESTTGKFLRVETFLFLSLPQKAKGLEATLVPKSAPLSLRELDPSYLPAEVNQFISFFPFMPPGIQRGPVKEMIEAFLPSIDRAIFLCETFLEHLSWMFLIVSRRQLLDELIPAIYKQTPTPVNYGPHELAVLLVTLGMGALVDLGQQPYNLEAQHYYRLARAALGLQSILTEPSVVTVKTLHLMSIYNGLSGKEANLEASYIYLDLASQVALRVGLHIDPSMWGFSGREAYERRTYFWNLLVAVLWQSLITGRPPSILQVYVDCKIPTEEEEAHFNGGGPPIGLGIWGHHITQSIHLLIVRAMLGVKAPTYETVMELDAKIRKLAQPDPNLGDERTAVSMRNFVRGHYLDLALLFLHRSYFAQVMISHAAAPLSSPYAPSIYAAYQAAVNILNDTYEQFNKNPELVSRVWRIWSFAFNAAVVVGTVAIRGASLQADANARKLEPEPWEVFQSTCGMFRDAAQTNSRAARALPVLQSMLMKAYHARQTYSGMEGPPTVAQDDELTVFGGRAEPIVRTPPSSASTGSPQQQSPLEAHQAPPPRQPQPRPSRQDTVVPPSRQATLRPQMVVPSNAPPPPDTSTPGLTLPPPPLAAFQQPPSTSLPLSLSALAYDSPPSRATQQHSWEGLFREAPDPVLSGLQTHGIQPGVHYEQYASTVGPGPPSAHLNPTMDDRWSSLMHNYGVLDPGDGVY